MYQEDSYNFKKSKKDYQEKSEKMLNKRFKSKQYHFFDEEPEEEYFYPEDDD